MYVALRVPNSLFSRLYTTSTHLCSEMHCITVHWYEILEQDITVNDKSNVGCFDPEVFVNCIQDQVKTSCIWFIINSCVLLKNLVSVYYQHNLWASTASCIHLPQPALLPPPTHTPELHPSPIPCTVGCEWPSTSKSRIRLSLAAGGRRGCLTWWGCHWERRQAPLGQYEWLGGETTTHNAMYTDFKLCMGS